MSSTWSTNLRLELIGGGEQAGNWGTTTNTNLGTLLEQAISGYVIQTMTGGTDTLVMNDGASSTARNMFLELQGTGGGTLAVPSNRKLYFIYNNCTSGAVTVKVTGLTGVSVPNGYKILLVCNGTDIVLATNYMVGNVTGNVTGNLTGNVTGNVTGNTSGSAGSVATTNFTIVESGGKLVFRYLGTDIASLDSTGNLIALTSVTGGATP